MARGCARAAAIKAAVYTAAAVMSASLCGSFNEEKFLEAVELFLSKTPSAREWDREILEEAKVVARKIAGEVAGGERVSWAERVIRALGL